MLRDRRSRRRESDPPRLRWQRSASPVGLSCVERAAGIEPARQGLEDLLTTNVMPASPFGVEPNAGVAPATSPIPRERRPTSTCSALWTCGESHPDAPACKARPRPLGQARCGVDGNRTRVSAMRTQRLPAGRRPRTPARNRTLFRGLGNHVATFAPVLSATYENRTRFTP